jgi:hypothetical protein
MNELLSRVVRIWLPIVWDKGPAEIGCDSQVSGFFER